MSQLIGDPSQTFLEVGKQYTMSFSVAGIPVPQTDLQASLRAFSGFAIAPIVCTADVSGYVDVTFVARVSTTIQVYYTTLEGIWQELYPAFDASYASIGDSKKDGLACGGTSNFTLDLVLIAVSILAIVFLASGGAGVIRRAVS